MTNFSKHAQELYDNGFSCSESVVRAAYECGFIDRNIDIDNIMKVSSVFSGGMSSGCLCGAVAGAQMIIGLLNGRADKSESSARVRSLAKDFITKFKEKRNTTCCRALSAKFKDDPVARRANCSSIVYESAEILEKILEYKKTAVV